MERKHEIHGNLARLLATENLDIQHAVVETASFNVETRTLTLPIWEKASDLVYQLLLSHECGHAIYTPNTDWTELTSVPMDFLNVTEDVRIEKLMKRRYPGLKKTFFNGYKELNEEDFFSISGKDVNEYNLADRINLYFKVGNFVTVDFNEKEQELVDEIEEAETFLDAIRCAEKLYEYCKDMEQQTMIDSISFESSSGTPTSSSGSGGQSSSQSFKVDGNGEDGGGQNSDGNETSNSDSNDTQNSGQESNSSENGQKGSSDYDPSSNFEAGYVKTASSLRQAINKLNSSSSTGINYVTIPDLNMDKIIVTPKKIHTLCINDWKYQPEEYFVSADTDYRKFKSSSKKEVAYLVKEFECKKAADSYSRASESKTGILDCGALHTYKFNDDIFKKVVTVSEGKNHGLIFILDWSGSMDNIILDTCRQLFKLIWFCKKVSIPFEVYAFTNSWNYTNSTGSFKMNDMVIDGSFNLLNMISSSVNTSTLELHMKNLYRLAYAHQGSYSRYPVPNGLNLSGTPLNESLVALHKIIPHFQSKTKVQKVQCVILTDGEAGALPRYTGNGGYGYSMIGDDCYLKDKKLKTTYRFPVYSYYATHKFTDVLLRHLKDVHPSVSFIGIRLLSAGEITSFVKNHLENNNDSQSYDEIMDDWKQNKSCAIRCAGYDSYFGIYSKSMNSSTEFQVEESDAGTTAIRNAFKKSLESKKMNRKILSQFADLIA
jgi:uncharacterized membrane protein YgcG